MSVDKDGEELEPSSFLSFFHNSHPYGCEVVSHCVPCIFKLLSVNRSSPCVDFYNILSTVTEEI